MSDQIRLPGLAEVRRRGFEALVRELGAANALRFLHLYGVGHGDYTRTETLGNPWNVSSCSALPHRRREAGRTSPQGP